MDLVISPDGVVRAIYAEDIDLGALGRTMTTRASHVEPDAEGGWIADLTPVSGPVLGPFSRSSQALEAEQRRLEANWLTAPAPTISLTTPFRPFFQLPNRSRLIPCASRSRCARRPGAGRAGMGSEELTHDATGTSDRHADWQAAHDHLTASIQLVVRAGQ